MANLTAERITPRMGPNPPYPIFVGGSSDGIPCAASAAKIWAGSMVGLDAAGNSVHAGAATAVRVAGIANETRDNSAGALGALSVPTRREGLWQMANSTVLDLISIADVGNECYVVDNQTVARTPGSLGARIVAGVVRGVDANGVWIEFTPDETATSASDITPNESLGLRVVRCAIHTNIASLASFTVAARDGLTLVEKDRVLLLNQTTTTENGIYEVGPVNAGSAGLSRAKDWVTGLVFGGLLIHIRAGTIFGDKKVRVTNTGAIVIGTDTPTLVPHMWKLSLTLASGTVTEAALAWVTATSKISAARSTTAGGVPGPCSAITARTNGVPGTGSITLVCGTLANPPVATATDNGVFIVDIDG